MQVRTSELPSQRSLGHFLHELYVSSCVLQHIRISRVRGSEYYTGWLTHWGESMANTSSAEVAQWLDKLLSMNMASVSLYMGHGGTNFGHWSGANGGGSRCGRCTFAWALFTDGRGMGWHVGAGWACVV